MEFSGQVTLVTGGASGIGLASARFFAERGARVFVFDREKGPPALGIESLVGDVTDLGALEAAAKAAAGRAGTLDAVVANAGIHAYGTVESMPWEDVRRVVDTNLMGAIATLRATLPYLRARKQGAAVLVASDQSFIGKANQFAYGATKAAVAHLARSAAVDYAPHGIRVNAVCAGTVDTPLYRRAIAESAKRSGKPVEELHQHLEKQQLLRRIARPEEVANVIGFLCSAYASFMTGALVPVDGGYTTV